jgi:hypothetical protein
VSGGDFTVVVQSETAAGAVLTVTPTPPVAAPAPAARPAPAAPGTVLPGSDDAAAAVPQAGDAAGFWGPPYDGLHALRSSPALESAADSSSGTGLLVGFAAAALAASALLVVRGMRRLRIRRG